MVLDIIFLIYSIIFLLIAVKGRRRIMMIFTGIAALFSLSSIFINVVLSLKYIPNVRKVIYLILFLVTMSFICFSSRKLKRSILGVIILISSCLIFFVYNDNVGLVYKNHNGKNYAGTYLKFDFGGSVVVTYYETKSRLFMAREYSFKDTFVGILGGIDDLFDYEPYERDFNEEYQ